MAESLPYTTQLQAGLGLVSETKALLELWSPGVSPQQLLQAALGSGRFPTVTARRLRNIIVECFAPRYLVSDARPARHLKQISGAVSSADLVQLMLLFTARANPILSDFIIDVYWTKYAGGHSEISNEDARRFVERSIHDGKAAKVWSKETVRRVSGYLSGCCADYGLLERGQKVVRRILPFRLASSVAAYLAYDLHFAGAGDNALLTHRDWQLFGLSREDVLEELKALARKGHLIIQAAGEVVRISWKHSSMEALCDVLSQS